MSVNIVGSVCLAFLLLLLLALFSLGFVLLSITRHAKAEATGFRAVKLKRISEGIRGILCRKSQFVFSEFAVRSRICERSFRERMRFLFFAFQRGSSG